MAAMESEENTQSRVMFQPTGKVDEPGHRKLGKLTVKYNRKDLQRRLDIEEWIDEQLHLLFDCEEEDIPELEIDIDELLELSDEGQRIRLQELLRECRKPIEFTPSRGFFLPSCPVSISWTPKQSSDF
ncbi:protein phosphatase 1 regulatory subunit 14B isoform X1 [Phycodurus eques]|uniref:protein phosphatase 1 regulatory subunit 14B isoform X1 n=1 Tax=Phycodurus eques TaxID=693459 RepID=UPI002ACD8711|nr:protein phosphatase 1 regulatory subunit 14B isoform X1 [Phycodurus eques]XP_061552071.1 protein phosphatase 1 regulatory subunit 14B isoform X1 [Phycodurus eques]XP_061552073.1 protein phosphatase 1 regulatory subunit 14B isoform X1 [Phycodurus eques]